MILYKFDSYWLFAFRIVQNWSTQIITVNLSILPKTYDHIHFHNNATYLKKKMHEKKQEIYQFLKFYKLKQNCKHTSQQCSNHLFVYCLYSNLLLLALSAFPPSFFIAVVSENLPMQAFHYRTPCLLYVVHNRKRCSSWE